jgi:hypothetical protein
MRDPDWEKDFRLSLKGNINKAMFIQACAN